ncbi:hypothetical protein MLD38_011329 [Melastoma candidum]|uniref:Uncharacterized protein n=1 Tax=Melastoma candidum TaxID=119954 RepID=A0ACB9R243_9MYRT|nr:hypothetical protein MLD38_011329 [Melastoma candidum]
MIASFLEIAVGQSDDVARQFLQATGWHLDEAIQLFYVSNDGSTLDRNSNLPNSIDGSGSTTYDDDNTRLPNAQPLNTRKIGRDDVRPPLPVKRDLLYDDPLFYEAPRMSNQPSSVVTFQNFDEEMKHSTVWKSEQGSTSAAENPRDNLASLYRLPFHLMFRGSFEKAKGVASQENKWLIVNMQSNREFSSHMLNRDTRANEAVSQTISNNFIFWQALHPELAIVIATPSTVRSYFRYPWEGNRRISSVIKGAPRSKACGAWPERPRSPGVRPYKGGGEASGWRGRRRRGARLTRKERRGGRRRQAGRRGDNSTSSAENMDEDAELQAALAASMEYMKASTVSAEDNMSVANKAEEACSAMEPAYPPLPKEPKGDRSLLCRVVVRLPDGRRVQRNFLRTDPIQLL